jgi:hypothetical protein
LHPAGFECGGTPALDPIRSNLTYSSPSRTPIA